MMMMDPAENDLLPPTSSPSISSASSSDLDTESTGSFFHDRSTTLGSLMGVTFPTLTFRTPSQSHTPSNSTTPVVPTTRRGRKKKGLVVLSERRRRWWNLCRDDVTKPASLGEFLEVERNEYYGAAVEYEGGMQHQQQREEGNGRVLFADGRVLPPAPRVEESPSTANVLCRFPLPGICSGGDG